MSASTAVKPRGPRPVLVEECCKGCGRCIESCARHCIEEGSAINPATGLVPVRLHLEDCTACGLCFDACPEPYGLRPEGQDTPINNDGDEPSGRAAAGQASSIPDQIVPFPASGPLVIKGNHAAAIGAILAGCRHVFGYPITPSTEGAELLAKLMPGLGGIFLQAPSEVATVNMMYGCGGAGLRSITFTSSPGFSLMLEGISYMIGSEVPGVLVNVMRGGPGLGNIAPEQSDVKLACRGLGHGNTHAIVLAPATPQEMLDLTVLAFDLSFRYRNPVIVLADGYLGQMTGKVELPRTMVKPGIPGWAVWGDGAHRGNLIASIYLLEADLERFNVHLNEKYAAMEAAEQRAELYRCDDAEVLLVAANTPARMAKGAVRVLRDLGLKVGLFRPISLWPFPIRALTPLLARARKIVVVEAGPGQIEDEMRLALSHAGVATPVIESVRHFGGVLPQPQEIVEKVLGGRGMVEEVRA
jgi:pyruvate/2-oxoacid:ferredoxin oxidoreductase alpha subunit/NAD-dependent dihydropyrimidine dehydrogenase PreA subunit